MCIRSLILLVYSVIIAIPANGQTLGKLLEKPDSWYQSKEAIRIADNVVLFQRNVGGWPKEWPLGKDYLKEYTVEEKEDIYNQKYRRDCTFDNGATHTEVRFLAKVYNATQNTEYRLAFLKGLRFMLEARYPNGGWPQYYPGSHQIWDPGISHWSPDGIAFFITYNDDAMTGVLWLLKDIAEKEEDFAFAGEKWQLEAAEAVTKGIDCILKSQWVYEGKLTAWPAQMDDRTFEPKWGRDFEPASIASRESVTIVRFLMTITPPDEKIINAIQGAVKWLDEVKILNTRVQETTDTFTIGSRSGRKDTYIEQDPEAPPVWARFYELNTFRPVFCSRGDSLKYNLSEISLERRSAYGWYGPWPQKLLSTEYPEWRRKYNVENVLK